MVPRENPTTGTWTAKVARPRGTSASTFHFTPDGRAFLVSGGVGAGTWDSTGRTSFSFRIAEPIIAEDGAFAGWVDISQHADRIGDTFTSTGTSIVYGADGVRKHSAQVQISAQLHR